MRSARKECQKEIAVYEYREEGRVRKILEKKELLELLQQMTTQEKCRELMQIPAEVFTETDISTGPCEELNLTAEKMTQIGSVLSLVGAERTGKVQKEHLKNNRLNIPLLFMADIINGYKTVFPIPLAQGCTFDPDLVRHLAEIAAREAAAAGIHVTFSPMADLVRDPRWGRVMESTGEDPYLNGIMAEQMVKGYQGDDPKEEGRLAACVKHFAGYGAPLGGREYNQVELSERTLFEDYFPAYERAIQAGARLVMSSFNTLERIPSTGNRKLMREILRGKMGFQGVLISDYAAVKELIAHGVAENETEAARLALEAGVDVDMMSCCYSDFLCGQVERGEVTQKLLDEAVLRMLELKNNLGLFENPFKDGSPEKEKEILLCEKHRSLAQKAAEESFVLLKNEENMLPLDEGEKTAFIGPFGEEKGLLGAWACFADRKDTVTVREGVESVCPGQIWAKGCRIPEYGQKWLRGYIPIAEGTWKQTEEETEKEFKEAVEAAAKADRVVLLMGEHELEAGESGSCGHIGLPLTQMKLLKAVAQVNPNLVLVIFSGRPLILTEVCAYAKAILFAWMPGTQGGSAVANVLYGRSNPSGKLTMTFPYDMGQIPVYYSDFSTGRPQLPGYIDIPKEPLYPFGYGLSYTEYAYSPVELGKKVLNSDRDVIHASVKVKNTGHMEGQEVVQLYIQDVKGSVSRPVRQLKGFQKIRLAPGEEKEVCFEIREEMLRFWNIDMEYRSEPGMFRVWIGTDSRTENGEEFYLRAE